MLETITVSHQSTMNNYLTFSEQALKAKGAYWTAKEINQQPNTWLSATKNLEQVRPQLRDWLGPILNTPDLRIILTGAGTSAYIGQTLAPFLSQQTNRVFEAISSTDLVSNTQQYLLKDKPTLVISFGRSGNSPESVAAIDVANQLVDKCYHLIVTCNAKGELAQNYQNSANYFSLLMPEQTLDNSFAMTSSFSTMLLTTLNVFVPDSSSTEQLAESTSRLISQFSADVKSLAESLPKRIIFLGSGGLKGMANEAALKCLELTSGKLISYAESPLGFRHGPKSIVDKDTLIIVLKSTDTYTRRYDEDLINELKCDNIANKIIVLDESFEATRHSLPDRYAGLLYITYCQIFAFNLSLALNISPDNPCPTGEVNRVVQGVNIYPLTV